VRADAARRALSRSRGDRRPRRRPPRLLRFRARLTGPHPGGKWVVSPAALPGIVPGGAGCPAVGGPAGGAGIRVVCAVWDAVSDGGAVAPAMASRARPEAPACAP